MAEPARWQPGHHVVRREVWHEQVWTGLPMWVVEDSDEVLALFLPTGAPLGFAAGQWPIESDRHPWDVGERPVWKGQGVLHLHRSGDPYCVIVFWADAARRFSRWYVNFQAPYRRTESGIETLDHVLDIVVQPDGSWVYKDVDDVDEAVALGLYTAAEAATVRGHAAAVGEMLDAGRQWWHDRWSRWTPTPALNEPRGLPLGWTER